MHFQSVGTAPSSTAPCAIAHSRRSIAPISPTVVVVSVTRSVDGDWTCGRAVSIHVQATRTRWMNDVGVELLLLLMLLVQVQGMVVGVPRGHQVAGRSTARRGWGREARGGGTALIWKDV